jgi:hypothetical protein
LLIFDVVGFFGVVGMAYYASRMIAKMRRGIFEKSWRYISYGAISLAVGVTLFVLVTFVSAIGEIGFDAGTVFACGGAVLLMLGLRDHYVSWTPDGIAKVHERNERKERDEWQKSMK